MSDKQDRNIAIIAAIASIGAIIYMAMRKSAASGSAPATPSGVGSGPSNGNPYSGALGFLGPYVGGPVEAMTAGGSSPFGSMGASAQVQSNAPMDGNSMFPLFGYAVSTSTSQGIVQILKAIMAENAAFQGFNHNQIVNQSGQRLYARGLGG